jgi:diacylglycerol kinase (ATP)
MLKKLNKNLFNSYNGLKFALAEHSFVIEILMGFIFFPCLIFFENSIEIKLLSAFSYFLILILELVNTAIEKVCNRMTLEYDEQIKAIKDISSAAVFMAIILFLITFLILASWFPKF